MLLFAGKSLEGIYRSSIGEYIWYYVIYDRQDEHIKENNTESDNASYHTKYDTTTDIVGRVLDTDAVHPTVQ